MGKKMTFQAILAQTKPTNAETNPHVILDELGFSHGARMAKQWYYIAVVDKQGHAQKSYRKPKNTFPFFKRLGPFWLGPAALVLPGGVPDGI